MRRNFRVYIVIPLITCFLCITCTEPLDFNQVNDFEISPIMETSLVYFNQPAPSFFNNNSQLVTVQDQVQTNFFNDSFMVENLKKAEFVFNGTNSINRAFQVRVDFFDNNLHLQHTLAFVVQASTSNNDVAYSHIENFENNTLIALKNTSLMVFTLNMLPGTPINQNTLGRISLKSKAVFYFNIANGL